jgi:hypothetical protein
MSLQTQLLNNNFGGIRRKDSAFTESKITCSDCQNVELFYTKLNSGVGIRTASGNSAVTIHKEDGTITSIIPEDEQVIEIFQSNQDGNEYTFVYTENEVEGKLYNYNRIANTLTKFNVSAGLGSDVLSKTGKACGTDFTQGWLDMFVFSNGKEVVYIYSDTEIHTQPTVESASKIKLVDTENRKVSGLGLVVYNDRLWIFNDRVLWYSQLGECRVFNYNDASINTSSGFIELVKPVTAIYPYLGSLAVFHKDSSVLVELNETTGFSLTDESPGGCASYKSLVFHGTDLYFYDDTKKGVFSFKQIVNGDKTLGENIALDIQEELMEINQTETHKIKALSVVTSDRNEVWLLVPISDDDNYSIVMIFDYLRGEWVKRKCQHINTIAMLHNSLFSGGKDIYEEYQTQLFNGEFIPSSYVCSILTLGADNTMKITKFPPRLTVDGNYKCDFYVKYVKNYATYKKAKIKAITSKQLPSVAKYDSGYFYDSGAIYVPNTINAIVKIPSATFKALEISFYTSNANQQFAIKAIEFSKVKVKQV